MAAPITFDITVNSVGGDVTNYYLVGFSNNAVNDGRIIGNQEPGKTK